MNILYRMQLCFHRVSLQCLMLLSENWINIQLLNISSKHCKGAQLTGSGVTNVTMEVIQQSKNEQKL